MEFNFKIYDKNICIELAKTPIGTPTGKCYNHFAQLCTSIADDFSKVLLYQTKNNTIGISGSGMEAPQGAYSKYSFPLGTNVTQNNVLNLRLAQEKLKCFQMVDSESQDIIKEIYDLISKLIAGIEEGKECIMFLKKPYHLFKTVIFTFKELSKKSKEDSQISLYLNAIRNDMQMITQSLSK